MADLEQRRNEWMYLLKVNKMGMLIQPDKIKEFHELSKQFGSAQREANEPATPRTIPVKPVDKAVPAAKIDKGKGRAVPVSSKSSEAGSIASSTKVLKNAEAVYIIKPAGSAETERIAEQMKYALLLQKEQGRGGNKSKSTKAGPSTPAKISRPPSSAASTSSRQTAFPSARPALKPVAFSPAPIGSLKTSNKPGPRVEISFAPSAASPSATTFGDSVAASTVRSTPASTPVTQFGSQSVGETGGGSNGSDVASTTAPVTMPPKPATLEPIKKDHDSQAKQMPRTVPPHLKNLVAAQLGAVPIAHEKEAKDKTSPKVGSKVATPSAIPSAILTNGFDDSATKIDMARMMKLENQVAALISENKAQGKQIIMLEEKIDLLNVGGPSIMAPFMATIKYPCGNTEQVQVRGNMRVNELLEHAITKRSVFLTPGSHLGLSYGGKQLGHLSYVGQVQPSKDGLLEILCA